MARPKKSVTAKLPTTDAAEESGAPPDEASAIEDGKILDYITGKPVAENDKERVRQRIARALFHEYGINVDDMEPDFKVRVEESGKSSNKKIDIAIFEADAEHTAANVRRLVVCQKELKLGDKGAYKMRDHDQAAKDLELLKDAMAACKNCKYGLWTNGLEFFFFQVKRTKFDVKFFPIGDWPLADESIGTRDVASHAKLRRADPEMLRTAFRRCHNFIHGNEGMPKDAAFWQFLYLIFAKMHDERQPNDRRRFWAGRFEKSGQLIDEQFDADGQKAIRKRILPLFEEVKEKYSTVFRGNEEITLSDRALAFMVSELAKYDFGRTDVDAKGAAYQEIVGTNLRGDRGQYFTPRGPIKLVVSMLDPKPHERVLDPACGTGGFLTATLAHLAHKFQAEKGIEPGAESTQEFLSVQERLAEYVKHNLFGADFDPFLVRATMMNLAMASNEPGNVFYMDSLSFPQGHLAGLEQAKKAIPFESVDVVMTNPPFGTEIPITDPQLLQRYELARKPGKAENGFAWGEGYQSAVAPEVLFIQRALDWLKPGGRLGIVLPDGILGNPGDEYIRRWILRHTWVLASIDLPVEVFIVEANVNILTSLLLLKKKPRSVIQAEDLRGAKDYPVFMAVAEKVGFDRRGNTLYKRSPDGEEILEEVEEVERIRTNGHFVERRLRRKKRIVDSDLPFSREGGGFVEGPIADAYKEFRKKNKEPGA
jgi:type I restriction enzyme M protein